MKILLTLDLEQPLSPERHSTEELMRFIWDQLQVIGASKIDVLSRPSQEMSLSEWASIIALKKQTALYQKFSSSPLESYDLVIGCDLRPETEAFFSSLGVRCITVRNVPCQGFQRFILTRSNFALPNEYITQLPSLNHLFHQDIPFVHVPFEERNWWLANRFLINQQNKYSKILFVGTTLFQAERIVNHKITNLASYPEEIKSLLVSSPAPYYSSRHPMDHEEIRFIKTLGISCPSLSLPTLLTRNEFDLIVSIDSGLVPVAASFNKPIKILGKKDPWSVLQLRQFRNTDFFSHLLSTEVSTSLTATISSC